MNEDKILCVIYSDMPLDRNGQKCVIELDYFENEIRDMIDPEDPEEITNFHFALRYYTQKEIDEMGEFDGF